LNLNKEHRKRVVAWRYLPLVMFGLLGTGTNLMAQDIKNIQTPDTPLTLQSRGSFFIGGETVEQSYVELGSRRPADRVTINQMFVEFMSPSGQRKTPVIMIHGAGLSGASFDTTPDGRMGWYEYFVRNAHPAYVIDQVGRARSGFNQAVFNNVSAGLESPEKQPPMIRMGDRFAAWANFRIGSADGVPFPDSQYPVQAASELSRQGIPDLGAALPIPNPNYQALSSLARQVDGAVLISHSQSGTYPIETALLNPSAVKAMVLVEPGSCAADSWTQEQIKTLAKVPLLIVYGDHLEAPTYLPGPGWQDRFDECERLIGRILHAHGQAEMLHPPKLGIRGNSHMIMQDKNNLQIADLILAWIDRSLQLSRAE
jgi:pimeloyl-ACP methyl ester carboxylesterase